MLKATVFETVAEVEVSGSSITEFSDSLTLLRRSIAPKDLEFNPSKKVWVVTNLDKYAEVPFIKVALEERARQPMLF